jgi:hypothetical protein
VVPPVQVFGENSVLGKLNYKNEYRDLKRKRKINSKSKEVEAI